MGTLLGKVALVTGAGQGIGQGIALAMAKAGAAVAVVGRTEAKLHATCSLIERSGGHSEPVVCDVKRAEDIGAAVARTVAVFGGIERGRRRASGAKTASA